MKCDSKDQIIAKMREALEFYASGGHADKCLNYVSQWQEGEPTGPVWWSWKRGLLEQEGWELQFEGDSGTEYFIENGTRAQKVLEEIDNETDPH